GEAMRLPYSNVRPPAMLQVPIPWLLALKSGWPVHGKGDCPAAMPSSPSSQPIPQPLESPNSTTSRCGSGGGEPPKHAPATSAVRMTQMESESLRIEFLPKRPEKCGRSLTRRQLGL